MKSKEEILLAFCEWKEYNGKWQTNENQVKTFLEEYKQQSEWINVEDRLPSEYGQPTDYLTCLQNGDIIFVPPSALMQWNNIIRLITPTLSFVYMGPTRIARDVQYFEQNY